MRCLARLSSKALLVLCSLLALLSLLLWTRCSRHSQSPPEPPERRRAPDGEEASPQDPPGAAGMPGKAGPRYEEIDCVINEEQTVKGRREGSEVFLPFSWVEKYFQVYGRISQSSDGSERFEFSHSYSKVYAQRAPYRPDGVFMSFEGYNVELRDRVKCISGVEGVLEVDLFRGTFLKVFQKWIWESGKGDGVKCISGVEGVPVSTQWGPQGYFYPIQIAQYGLSHYSKNLTEKPPRVEVYETAGDGNGGGGNEGEWTVPKGCSLATVWDESRLTAVKQFSCPENSEGISLELNNARDFIISLDLKFQGNGSVSVVLETTERGRPFTLHYVSGSTRLISLRDRDVSYGIGARGAWSTLTRDLLTDLRKGAGLSNTKAVRQTRVAPRKLLRLVARGRGLLDNVTVSATAHAAAFFAASRWLLRNQDGRGGWPIAVTRKLGKASSPWIPAGTRPWRKGRPCPPWSGRTG
ncbi:hypothetical protein DUI87_28999 [Hirundo rustica rustica]|uniref:D-glucuronyl C5-epimerase beta-sandwich domain-containing protein n=1 Tax=Hirundo rustica rustica TaxID=333673 RepID=A0A3M0J5Q6_HIRRU|nr:hypothetical protein DUI87_28999 [Hirundo rustica rustica]